MLTKLYSVAPAASIFEVSADLIKFFKDQRVTTPLTISLGTCIYLREFEEALTAVPLGFLEVDRGSINGRAHETTGITMTVSCPSEAPRILGFLAFVEQLQANITTTEIDRKERLAQAGQSERFYGKCGSGRFYGSVLQGLFSADRPTP